MTESINPMPRSTSPDDASAQASPALFAPAEEQLPSIHDILKTTVAWLRPPGLVSTATESGSRLRPTAHRSDPAWVVAAAQYLRATQALEVAVAAQEAAKVVLYGLSSAPQVRGCGVVVTIPGRWSEIDHAKAMALLGLDAQRYWDQCMDATVEIDS